MRYTVLLVGLLIAILFSSVNAENLEKPPNEARLKLRLNWNRKIRSLAMH